MKKKSLAKFLMAFGLTMTVLTPAIAGTTSTGSLTLNATVNDALSIAIENDAGTSLLTSLNFGTVNGIGAGSIGGSTDAVKLVKTDNSLVSPASAVGSGYTGGAFYIVGSNAANSGVKVRVRITGGADADVRVKQSAGGTLSPYYSASNFNWATTSGGSTPPITTTDVTLAGTGGLTTARADDQTVDMDLAIKVLTTDTAGAKSSTLVFTADSNAF